jgi:hypothetical protein
MEVAPVADTRNTDKDAGKSGRTDRVDPADAATQLTAGMPADTIDGALGPNWQAWQDHVKAHVQPLDDADVTDEPRVPLLVYGSGPNDYIATDVDAGQVMVRDGNDKTGKAWKFPLASFMRFVAHAHGLKVKDEDGKPEGDDPLTAAIEQRKRTNKLIQADRDATAEARHDGARK